MEQRQLVGLITRRSEVRILPPQPTHLLENPGSRPPGVLPFRDTVAMAILVREATAADGEVVRAIAAAAWRDTYAGLLRSETIEAFLERAYSVERVARRIGSDTFLLASVDGSPVAFADAREDGDQLHLLAIYALPERRGRGAGSALLAELRRRFPALPIAAEVLRDNLKGETFYAARGFEPRETVEAELFGEPVVERRWWLDATGAPG